MHWINFDEFSPRERYVYDFYKDIIKHNDTVIDVGACHGLHTVPFLYMVGSRGHVVAIEPQADYADKMRYYQFRNGPKLDIIVAAAGEEDGKIKFIQHSEAGNSHVKGYGLTDKEGTEITVPLLTVDSLNLQPKFIKIDTEGYELNVLRGARKTIELSRPHMSIEADETEPVKDFFSELDYTIIEKEPYDLLLIPR